MCVGIDDCGFVVGAYILMGLGRRKELDVRLNLSLCIPIDTQMLCWIFAMSIEPSTYMVLVCYANTLLQVHERERTSHRYMMSALPRVYM
ncbi:hypothetical protein DPMN_100821 [Dreissena polymorpha]|uniref:Uncharacterized protein n=1 Tax=Dreissena polymorpha TaxID=45954 RepID=A0A9D4LGG1_DREPO|nr:hypothetical protein DPMN_100821 [Dreissena polymorpha]